MLNLIIFCSAYIGMALGKIPGLIIDRVGIALLGAIAMVVSGVVTPEDVLKSIDLPTILLLYALMIISAQLRLGGWVHLGCTGNCAILYPSKTVFIVHHGCKCPVVTIIGK